MKAGQTYRISDIDPPAAVLHLNTVPDAELVKLANAARCTPMTLEKQAAACWRPRAESSTRLLRRLRLQDVEKIHPDALLFPASTTSWRPSYKATELFFNSIVQEDCNVPT